MKKNYRLLLITTFLVLVFSTCSEKKSNQVDVVNDLFPEAQKELRQVIKSIVRDTETANIKGLKSIHLVSDKFTKFGPRNFDRQDVEATNESESAHFGSISNFKLEVKDLKIDVFEDIGIATYYPHFSFERNGVGTKADGRQTLVFLKTNEGWKIIHEHGTKRFQ